MAEKKFIIEVNFKISFGNVMREFIYDISDDGQVYFVGDVGKARQYRADQVEYVKKYLKCVLPHRFRMFYEEIKIDSLEVNF